ncbi:uncharacterized protein LOC135845006 [Planococcus citri]|uniref:uncharacterized protein LOC135845006 n=1 Tax=Planococcus citri TaxID=170843 RepID=UPI0031F998C7
MTMSPDQQWISTVSMNRFYDYCHLIECAYHIISRYCCSFTNLLNHDDGSIPYYLVQKVKIAVEYGRMLLNSRYRPFQHQLRGLGAYDYIDQHQYEGLCIQWNAIKAETQVVEMFFNQISLLIYPVVSATSLPFIESKPNEEVSALTKINAIIHSLINQENNSRKSHEKTKRIAPKRPKYFSEEELGVFIVNNIIEPLFDDEDEPKKNGNGKETRDKDYSSRYDRFRQSFKKPTDGPERFENFLINFNKVEILRNNDSDKPNDKRRDHYNINLSTDLFFKFDDENVLMNCNRYNSPLRFGNQFYGFETFCKYDCKGDNTLTNDKKFSDKVKYDAKKFKDNKFAKKVLDKGKLPYGNYEFNNKKFVDNYQHGKNFIRVE